MAREVISAKKPERMPVVLTPEEVSAISGKMSGTSAVVARLLYGSGLRLVEGVRLRVKDVDFARREIMVWDGKGAKDRMTITRTCSTAAAGAC
jgi:site-specific recombinase XerD